MDKQRINLNLSLRCPSCLDPVPNIVEDYKQGDIICVSCGTVFKDRIIDTRSEWRTFSNDDGGDDPSRVGNAENALLNNSNYLETAISPQDGGKGMSKDLQKTQIKNSTALRSNRVLLNGFQDIASLGERMGLQRNVIEAAKQYFKLTDEQSLVRGRTEVVAAVCLLLGCRKTGNGRTFQEFADLVRTSKHEFGKMFTMINRVVANLGNVNGEDICARYCNALGLSHQIAQTASILCANARQIPEMASRTPSTIAGASIYMACNLLSETKAAKDIAMIVKVSEGTVRQGYRNLMAHLDICLGQELLHLREKNLYE